MNNRASLIHHSQQIPYYDTLGIKEKTPTTSWFSLTTLIPSYIALKDYIPSWESIKYYLPSYNNLHPLLTSLIKTAPLMLFAVCTSTTLLPYSFGFPTGTSPMDFSMDWFLELSLYYQIVSIVNSVVFLGVESLVRYDLFSGMGNRLHAILKKCCRTMTEMISAIVILFFSSTAAIAAGGWGYDSFQWYPSLALASAVTNAAVVAAFRIEFMAAFIESIKKKYNDDAQFQQRVIQLLQKINHENEREFNTLFPQETINTDNASQFLHFIFTKAAIRTQADLNLDSIFRANTVKDKIKNYLGQGLDYTTGLIFGGAFGGFFMVNGYYGLTILCDLFASHCTMDALLGHEQIMIAALTGASSAILGFMTGIKLRTIVQASYEHIQKYPHDLIKLLVILMVCSTPESTIWSAVQDILGKGNILGLTQNMMGTLFAIANTALIGVFCYDPLYRMLIHKEDDSFSIKNLGTWLQHHDLPKEAITSLKEHSFFSKKFNPQEDEYLNLTSTVAYV